jgi:hypothetical protein
MWLGCQLQELGLKLDGARGAVFVEGVRADADLGSSMIVRTCSPSARAKRREESLVRLGSSPTHVVLES